MSLQPSVPGSAPSPRRRRRLRVLLPAVAAVLVATTVVWHAAYAGFSTTTAARALPTVTTGTVVLADDDSGARMFTATGLKPGATATKCIKVTSTGSVPATVRLYGTGLSTTNSMSRYLTLAVYVGTGGSTASCSGFNGSSVYNGSLAGFPIDSYANGVGPWTTTGATTETRTYAVVYTLSSSTPTSVQGGSAGVTFVWEARQADGRTR